MPEHPDLKKVIIETDVHIFNKQTFQTLKHLILRILIYLRCHVGLLTCTQILG